jgi:hypothetical protein
MSDLPLQDWRDFYVMIGTASGAIVGASFIVASLASGIKDRALGIRGFITPTTYHLASVLIGSAILSVPKIGALAAALLLGGGGIAGAVYSVSVLARIWKMPLDFADWMFYALLPLVAYAALPAAAAMILLNAGAPLYLLASALILLLIVGMRNAWDMASFLIMREHE